MADLISSIWGEPKQGAPKFTNLEWESLLGQARRSGLAARLAVLFLHQCWMQFVPQRVEQHLKSFLRLVDRQRNEVLWEIDQISKALAVVQTPVVLLKGAAYLYAELPPAEGRLFSDIDIMVAHEHLPAVESALFAAGWISDERDAYNQRYYRRWMHEIPPMRHVARGSVIDLHHTISPPTSKFKVDGALLLANVLPTKTPGLYVLEPIDMILHSAAHLYQEGKFDRGLRDLLDLRDLIAHFQNERDFWPALLSRGQSLGLTEPLFHALCHIQRLFGLTVPAAFSTQLDLFQPNRLSRYVLGQLLELALRPNHPACDTVFTGLARWLLYVRSHLIRMPVYLLVPHLLRKAYMERFPAKNS